MNKYINRVIFTAGVCSVGLTTLSFAQDKVSYEPPHTVKDIQLQRLDNHLDNHLALNSKQIEDEANQKQQKAISKSVNLKPIPSVALNLVKEFEGFESQAYIDTDGTPVIGYGLSKISGESVQMGDRISSAEADVALNNQMREIQQELDQVIEVELSDRQLSAVASLAFNVGVNFIQDSTLVRKINSRDYRGAANEFLRWDKANVRGRLVQMPGLTRRRQAERRLFLKG